MDAAYYGRTDMVRFLLERGADIHATAVHGETALHLASKKNHAEIAALLRAAGARK